MAHCDAGGAGAIHSIRFRDADAMLVESTGGAVTTRAPDVEVVYCPRSRPALYQRLLDGLLATGG